MTKTKFVRDRREKVLNAIRIIHPAFQPDYTPPDPFYDNVLMVKLNDHLKPLSENFDPQVCCPVVTGLHWDVFDESVCYIPTVH